MGRSLLCVNPKCQSAFDSKELKLHAIPLKSALVIKNNFKKCCYQGKCPKCGTKVSYDIQEVEGKDPRAES